MNKNTNNTHILKWTIPLLFIVVIIAFTLLTVIIDSSIYPIWTKKVRIYNSDYILSTEESDKLKKLKNITNLDISAADIENINFFSNMYSIEKLRLYRFPVTIDKEKLKKLDFSNISGNKNLQDVELCFCGADNLNYFTDINSLNCLSITGEYETVNFSKCSSEHLEKLILDSVIITDFSGIENFRNLNYLSIGYTFKQRNFQLDSEISVDISPISSLCKLETFKLSDFPYKIQLSEINNPLLKKIVIDDCKPNIIQSKWFSSFPLLEEITLCGMEISDITKIDNPHINYIKFYNCKTGDIPSDWLVSFCELQKIDIRGSKISDIENIVSCKNLKEIIISPEMYSEDEIRYLYSKGIVVKSNENTMVHLSD